MTIPPGSVRDRIERDGRFLDSAVVSHGYAPFLRDYDVIVEVPAATPDGTRSYIMGRFRYRFTHCTESIIRTTVGSATWRKSWGDLFTDYQAWDDAGAPDGYVWGVCYAQAYPGMSYVDGSPRARHWTGEVGQEMHEVCIQTNAWEIHIVFHELEVDQVAIGDPVTGELSDLTD